MVKWICMLECMMNLEPKLKIKKRVFSLQHEKTIMRVINKNKRNPIKKDFSCFYVLDDYI